MVINGGVSNGCCCNWRNWIPWSKLSLRNFYRRGYYSLAHCPGHCILNGFSLLKYFDLKKGDLTMHAYGYDNSGVGAGIIAIAVLILIALGVIF